MSDTKPAAPEGRLDPLVGRWPSGWSVEKENGVYRVEQTSNGKFVCATWVADYVLTRFLDNLLRAQSTSLDYECQDCIGMREHGCYCKAMGADQPGGPMTPNGAVSDVSAAGRNDDE